VEHWIETICEPKRLLLAWQGPDPKGDRTRFAVGELIRENSGALLRYFSREKLENAYALGFEGYPAFKLDQREHRLGVMEAFLRRLPPRSRADFTAYRTQFRLQAKLEISDFALLAYTEAKLPSDGFSIVNPLEDVCGPCQFVFEVAGYRYYASEIVTPLSVGQPLRFVPEPTNERDPNAVKVEANDELIGYVNRLQAVAFLSWIRDGLVSGWIERLNGNIDKPRAFMFVRVLPRKSAEAA
jgi:hypothetical protein